MFPRSYFGPRFFADRYYPIGGEPVIPELPNDTRGTVTGGASALFSVKGGVSQT